MEIGKWLRAGEKYRRFSLEWLCAWAATPAQRGLKTSRRAEPGTSLESGWWLRRRRMSGAAHGQSRSTFLFATSQGGGDFAPVSA